MKSRASLAVGGLVLVALAAMAAWTWYGHEYRVHIRPGQLELTAAVVTVDRRGDPALSVALHNLSGGTIVVMRSPELRGPFEVLLVSREKGREIPRLPGPPGGPPGSAFDLRASGKESWTVGLAKLYGKLPPGGYVLQVTYDTEAAERSGQKWVRELDLGRVESPQVVFEIKPEEKPPNALAPDKL